MTGALTSTESGTTKLSTLSMVMPRFSSRPSSFSACSNTCVGLSISSFAPGCAARQVETASGVLLHGEHLNNCARKAIQNEAHAAFRPLHGLPNEAHHNVIGHQRPSIHGLLCLRMCQKEDLVSAKRIPTRTGHRTLQRIGSSPPALEVSWRTPPP